MEIIRAYSTVHLKAAGQSADGRRVFTGVASTPSTDLMGDIVEPLGIDYALPTPLLWQHDSAQPIGWVTAAKVSKDGMAVTAEVADTSSFSGALKARIDEAWQAISAGLVRGLSIGFQVVESARIEGTYGYRYIKTKLLELSAVTIPANQDASVTAIKAHDVFLGSGAALGAHRTRSGVVYLDHAAQAAANSPGDSGAKQRRKGAVYL